MIFAEVTTKMNIPWGQVISTVGPIIGLLIGSGVFLSSFNFSKIGGSFKGGKNWLAGWLSSGTLILGEVDETVSSDRPAPEGFAEHVATIIEASKGCPPETREQYFREALTEAQTLRKENERLTGKKSDRKPPVQENRT